MSAERTAKAIVAGTWGCAAIVMAGSATNAFLAYGALGDNRGLGLATGLAVDIGLCVALIGDRRLYAEGLSSIWGRVLRITTAVMSLILNTCISLRDGHYLSALMHAFLPLLLVVLTEYGQDVLLKFTALARKADEAAVKAVPIPEPLPAYRPAPLPVPVVSAPPPVVPKPVVTKQSSSDPETRLRELIRDTGQTPGRRKIAEQLGITEHQARTLLAKVSASSERAVLANGAGSVR